MAVVLVFRAAVLLAPVGYKIVQAVMSGPTLPTWDRRYDEIVRGNDADEDVSADLTAYTGTLHVVTTFPGPFTLHLLQMKWGRDSGVSSPEDDAICTFHFAKVAGGVLVDPFTGADFDMLEAKLDTWWTTIAPRTNSHIRLREYRWFRAGPDVDAELGGQGRTGPPVRVVARDIVGGSLGMPALPPQVAMSVTEKTADPKSWGRFYLPGLGTHTGAGANIANDGRFTAEILDLVADATEILYQGCSDEALPIVVYSNAKSERPSAGGGTLPAIGARAMTVDSLVVDDLPDVIRSRRYAQAHIRETRAGVAA